MAISDTQKVDYLWKKIGYAATKTDTTANKDATNEALPSPLQIRGDSLLVQSSSIPSSIPATTTSIVSVYRPDATLEMPLTAIGTNGPGQRGQLGSATAYRTWQTGLQNWISPEFGATYSVRVFLDTPGITTSNTTGTELFATASNEEWFFDYQSGVLNFSGANLPSGISTKSVYISGARYTGEIGIANTVNTGAAAFAQANAAFAAANAAGSSTFVLWAANNSNSAFETANGAVAVNTTQNNSITVALNTSNAAFVHANAAFTAANNATDTYVRNHANAAFDTANGAVAVNTTQNNSITVALDTANAAFANANSYITYNEAVNVTQNNSIAAAFAAANAATATDATQNNSIASAFIHANAAFASANNIDGVNTTQNNSITAAFAAANAATATDATQNNSITVALDTANAAFANANSYITYNEAVNVTQNNSIAASFDTANGAVAVNLTQNNSIAAVFLQSNNNVGVDLTQNNSIAAAFTRANNSLNANTGGQVTGDVIVVGNISANMVSTTGSNGTIGNANAIFSNYVFAANGAVDLYIYTTNAYNKANASFASANAIDGINTTQNNSITAAFAAANAATATDATQNNSIAASFVRANNSLDANNGGTVTGQVIITGNLIVTGTTTYANTVNQFIADNIITLNADLPQDGYPSENAGLEIERGVLPNSSILFVEASAKWSANNGNTSYFLAAEDRVDAAFNHANSVFANANSYITYNEAVSVTQNNSIVASFIHANSAYQSQNATGQYANAAFIHANSGFIHANAVFANANSYITYNEAVSVTQNNRITAAFIRANNSLNANTGGNITGEVVVVGNLTSNTLTTTGSNGSITGANAIFSNYVFAANGNVDLYLYTTNAYNQSNAAFASANSIDGINTTQNNSITAAFLAANAATATDVTQNNSIAASFVHANASFASANNIDGVNTTQNNSIASAFVHANAVFANANSYITYNEAVSVTQNNSITAAFVHANASFASANNIDGVNTTQNNSIIVALNTANAAYSNSNTYITYNESVSVTQNNSITAAFAAANAATATDATQNNSITAAFVRANNSLDANNGGTISGDIVITGNLTANIVGGTF